MAGAQQGVTFALKINKNQNKNVPRVGAQQRLSPFQYGRAFFEIIINKLHDKF